MKLSRPLKNLEVLKFAQVHPHVSKHLTLLIRTCTSACAIWSRSSTCQVRDPTVPYVQAADNKIADFFTKPLNATKFYAMRRRIMNEPHGGSREPVS